LLGSLVVGADKGSMAEESICTSTTKFMSEYSIDESLAHTGIVS